MAIAAETGISIAELGDMTPYEIHLYIKSYADKAQRTQEEQTALAYLTALWTAQWLASKKKPEKLQTILQRSRPRKIMTDREMLQSVQILHRALGGD